MQPIDIINNLPYTEPFLFVDELLSVSEKEIIGTYTFKKDAYFYEGHFKNFPLTPGVLLIECMAQIGLVCLAIFLLKKENEGSHPNFVLSNTQIDFLLPVYPDEKVKVVSEKIYFRFQKLKCKVKMFNTNEQLIAQGTISGIAQEKGSGKDNPQL